MAIFYVKVLHILGSMLFLGTGLGSAYYKLRAARSGDARVMAWVDSEIVTADWLFTVPAGVIMPLSGFWLVSLYGMPWDTPFVVWGLGGYVVAGATWLPAAWLQIKMKRLSGAAAARGEAVPAEYAPLQRTWAMLGVPSFAAAVMVVWVMVTKRGL